ncbi:tripartite tricarboxylate transporter substrate binding protein [Enterocloster bolteae]|uniref:tripartite tricarboxylate transporter substrate binding protein n=1 Tax=Enterocloster bolteae TaxID=208479 RepID=UPI000465A15B|nr:tripartite tricarboxylate transporter substrate binding protein [Enterocloster bolteae]UOX71197.1 tripartite tricarboxylate transporter substrate binding protein [Enterocloster bolteae]
MKRKTMGIICGGIVLAMTLAGCQAKNAETPASKESQAQAGQVDSQDAESAAGWEFERKIEIVCPWGAGGAADITLRAFTAELEKELDVPIVINNKSGAGGTTGVEFAMKQPADGYTFLLCTPSPLLAQINGSTELDVYGGIEPVTRLVHDINIIVTGKDSPYQTFEELMAYIDANPGKVKCGVMAVTGLDGLTVEQIFGDKVETIAYNEGPEMNAAIIGGHLDLAVAGPSDCMALVQSGDMRPLLTAAEQRMTVPEYKDVPCTKELGIDAYLGPYRGIFVKKGTPEEAIAAFEAAAKKAADSQEFKQWMTEQGLDQRPGYQNRAEFKETWDKDFSLLTELVESVKD